MLIHTLEELANRYKLEEKDLGSQVSMKVGKWKYRLFQCEVEGFGNLAIVEGTTCFGRQLTDILLLTPTKVDVPTFFYQREFAKKQDTIRVELLDTVLDVSTETYKEGMKKLLQVKKAYGTVNDYALEQWYDAMKLEVSFTKRGQQVTELLDQMYCHMLDAYLALMQSAPACDETKKIEKIRSFEEALFVKGGTFTDTFVKALGKERTSQLYHDIIFGI